MADEELKELTQEELEEVAGGLRFEQYTERLASVFGEVKSLGLAKDQARSLYASKLADNLPLSLEGDRPNKLIESLLEVANGGLASTAQGLADNNSLALVKKLLSYFDNNWDQG